MRCAGEALAHEVRRFGARVVNVEPGVVMPATFEIAAGKVSRSCAVTANSAIARAPQR
jgi:NAD(P)-dependent dehydrogenase (short-subunit alcohol dehydrogenase family)